MAQDAISKEALEATINTLLDVFSSEGVRVYRPLIEEIKKKRSYLDLTNPDHVEDIVCIDISLLKDLLIDDAVSLFLEKHNITKKELQNSSDVKLAYVKLHSIFDSYSFYDEHLENFFTEYEGLACCCDKGSFLLQNYLNLLLGKNLPEIDKKEKEFWKPEIGTMTEWMEFIDSLYMLKQGKEVDKYIAARQSLISQYTEKQMMHEEEQVDG